SHATSNLVGEFQATHIRKISTTPSVNGKLRKLCAYFAHCDQMVKVSGPTRGSSSSLPKVILRPDSARITKQLAVIQCTNRSNALKRTRVRPDRPASIRTMPRMR